MFNVLQATSLFSQFIDTIIRFLFIHVGIISKIPLSAKMKTPSLLLPALLTE